MLKQELRLRMLRILRGDIRVDDLSTLFLTLRDLDRSRNTILEIGYFVAYRTERSHGFITEDTRDFFASMRFMALKISNDLDKHDLPEETDVVLRTTLERLDSKILKDKTGLRRQDAHKLLQSFLARNERGEKGGRVLRYRTEQEGALLETLTRYLVVRSAFDDQRLYTELLQSLREANLLLATEIPSFRRLKQIFALRRIYPPRQPRYPCDGKRSRIAWRFRRDKYRRLGDRRNHAFWPAD